MALLNTINTVEMQSVLTRWLGSKLSDARDVDIRDLTVASSSGMSMTTVLFQAAFTTDAGAREMDLVTRVAPAPESRVFRELDLEREFKVVEALDATPIPVPTPRWLERDASLLGAPFIVADRVYGESLGDDPPWTGKGWVIDLPADSRRTLMTNGLETMAAVHRLDWRALGFEFLDRPEFGPKGVEQQIGEWYASYEWSATIGCNPTIEAGFEWIRDNRPADGEIVFTWGDARPGNLIFGEDLSVRAALDWEMATLTGPETDLAWWLWLQRHHTEGLGLPLPHGIPTHDETIAIYEDLTGRTVTNMEFHERFAALRSAVIMMRVATLLIAGGALPQGHPMPFANPSSILLAKMLGLPVPTGATGGFLGDRF